MKASSPTTSLFPLLGKAATILERFDLPVDALAARKVLEGKTPPEIARMAIQLAALRVRARDKTPLASRMLFTKKGLEQSTDGRICAWRAREIARILPNRFILDATCGIGAESLALLQQGQRVVSSDLDPLHAACCSANIAAAGFPNRVLVADARFPVLDPEILVLDPDRRAKNESSAGSKPGAFASRLDPASWSPDLSEVVKLLTAVPAGCVKLPPGIDAMEVQALLDTIAPDLPRRFTWTESGNNLRELALWTGELAPPSEPTHMSVRILGGPMKALDAPIQAITLGGASTDLVDEPALAPETSCTEPGRPILRWLVEPRASVIRAGLIGALARELSMAPIDPFMAYLGGISEAPPKPHPLARTYRVLDAAPLDRKLVRKMLKAHDVGQLTVKKRGHKASADELAARYRGPGKATGWLVIARVGRSHRAFLVEPVE